MVSAALRRVTELFIEGTECVLDENEPVLVWVNKLNPFEVDEARRDGHAARTRLTLALEDPRSEESQLFDTQSAKLDDEVVALGMAAAKYNEDLVRASEDLRADEEWADKLNMIERANELRDRPEGDPERVAVDKVADEYMAELDERVEVLRQQKLAELKALPKDELRVKYRKEWVNQRGTEAFMTEYKISELYEALRQCVATVKDDNGRWQHDGCDHRQKLLDDRSEVRGLPEGLVNKVSPVLTNLAVDDRSAKGQVAESSSSDSSQRPNAQEDSAASTPAAKRRGAATTSTKR